MLPFLANENGAGTCANAFNYSLLSVMLSHNPLLLEVYPYLQVVCGSKPPKFPPKGQLSLFLKNLSTRPDYQQCCSQRKGKWRSFLPEWQPRFRTNFGFWKPLLLCFSWQRNTGRSNSAHHKKLQWINCMSHVAWTTLYLVRKRTGVELHHILKKSHQKICWVFPELIWHLMLWSISRGKQDSSWVLRLLNSYAGYLLDYRHKRGVLNIWIKLSTPRSKPPAGNRCPTNEESQFTINTRGNFVNTM